jgi:cytochrome c oxidase assembly factor CtaG
VKRLALALALAPALAAALEAAPSATGSGGPEPWMAFPMAAAACLYGLGFCRIWRRAQHGRAALARRAWIFLAGWAALAAATLSPLHELGARSFTAHMIEHELIMLAAAPTLVWSRPLGVMLWAFGSGGRHALAGIPRSRLGGGAWRIVSDPWVSTVLQAATIWVWHLPTLFDRALRGEGWHAAQHLCFFLSALVFWSGMLGPRRSAWVSAVCLFATSMITGALGAFMALSVSPWYAGYAALGLAAFGLTPAQDQQLAGVLMWVPGGLFHAIVAIALLAPLLRSPPPGQIADA